MPPIGGIAKQAGFAKCRYGDQLHGSDRDLRCSFVSMHIIDRLASPRYQPSTLIRPDEEMLAGVPRERSRATRAVDEWIRVERDEYWCIGSFTTLMEATTVRSDVYHRRCKVRNEAHIKTYLPCLARASLLGEAVGDNRTFSLWILPHLEIPP